MASSNARQPELRGQLVSLVGHEGQGQQHDRREGEGVAVGEAAAERR